MTDDPAQVPVGTERVFRRGELRRTFKRLPSGWLEEDNWVSGGRYLDDVSFDEEGWKPAD
ncbi:hypothetical protein NFI95_15440 [Acetobacteraceae bacterium KSS8]|uniref:Uncharacterized protein n=1 Tax=Endosaccharibacter trunci TaxID=2812733 RepID=A0ABT1WAD4_9PROT|nr:hypothetical protein [Acetobacteraceae bacterium KSS8]